MPSARVSAQLLIAIALAIGSGCRHKAKVPEGDVAATLTLPSVGPHPFDPASLRGKPALVLFVTPTCPHCRATMPVAARAAAAAGASVVAVFIAGKQDAASTVVSTTRFSGPALMDDGALRVRYDITRVPYTVVLGGDGHARAAFTGEQDEATFRDALTAAD